MVPLVALRQAEHLPWLVVEHVTGEVVLVQALHDDDARVLGADPSGDDGAVVPVVGPVQDHLRGGVGGLGIDRVVDQDAVAVLA